MMPNNFVVVTIYVYYRLSKSKLLIYSTSDKSNNIIGRTGIRLSTHYCAYISYTFSIFNTYIYIYTQVLYFIEYTCYIRWISSNFSILLGRVFNIITIEYYDFLHCTEASHMYIVMYCEMW